MICGTPECVLFETDFGRCLDYRSSRQKVSPTGKPPQAAAGGLRRSALAELLPPHRACLYRRVRMLHEAAIRSLLRRACLRRIWLGAKSPSLSIMDKPFGFYGSLAESRRRACAFVQARRNGVRVCPSAPRGRTDAVVATSRTIQAFVRRQALPQSCAKSINLHI